MAPLIVLLSVMMVSLVVIRIYRGEFRVALAGRIAMAAMLVFTALGHFVYAQGMSMMLPDPVPFKMPVIIVTGIMELLAAIGLLTHAYRSITGWLLIVFFILLLPANIYAAIHHVNYQRGTLDGNGPAYLWFRVPLQMLFITWTWWSAIRKREGVPGY